MKNSNIFTIVLLFVFATASACVWGAADAGTPDPRAILIEDLDRDLIRVYKKYKIPCSQHFVKGHLELIIDDVIGGLNVYKPRLSDKEKATILSKFLYYAAGLGEVETLKKLLQYEGIDVNYRYEYDTRPPVVLRPLTVAIDFHQHQIVRELVRDPRINMAADIKTQYGKTILDLAQQKVYGTRGQVSCVLIQQYAICCNCNRQKTTEMKMHYDADKEKSYCNACYQKKLKKSKKDSSQLAVQPVENRACNTCRLKVLPSYGKADMGDIDPLLECLECYCIKNGD